MGTSSSKRKRKNPYPAEHTDMKKILLLGNPGRGKSLIGNTLVGRKVFNSGASISCSSGLTTELQSHTSELKWLKNWCIVDLPGVMDIDKDYEPLATNALCHAGEEVVVLFVVQLNGLHVDMQEGFMIDSFMKACKRQITSYGILLNKVSPKSMEKLLANDGKCLERIKRDVTKFAMKNCDAKSLGHVAPLLMEKDEPTILKDSKNLQLLENLIKEVTPVKLEKDKIEKVGGGMDSIQKNTKEFRSWFNAETAAKIVEVLVVLVSGALQIFGMIRGHKAAGY